MELIAAAKAKSLPQPILKSACILSQDVNGSHCVNTESHSSTILGSAD